MSATRHGRLLALALALWGAFWLAGLPDYYQQYSAVAMGIGSIGLSVAISLAALFILLRGQPETRLRRALWISFYFTVPLAVLDSFYCGIYLGHGAAFLGRYWYLSVFYVTPWMTFVPTALLLRSQREGGPT